MPAWTLNELMSNATARIGHRADLDAVSVVSFWVNAAYQDVAQATSHALLEAEQSFSVNSGTSLLTLPADFLEIIDLSFSTDVGSGSGRTLVPTTPEWADAQGYLPLGEPQKYFIFGDEIQLWPSANSSANTTAWSGRSYTMRYRKRAVDLTTGTSVPSVDTEWRPSILLRAEAYLHEYVGNTEEAAAKLAQFFGTVNSLKDAQARRQAARGRFAISLPLRRHRRLSSRQSF